MVRLIRNNTKKVMDDLGLSVTSVADHTGINRSVVGRMYRNEVANVNLDVLDALCDELNVPAGWLLEYVPDESMTDADREHLRVRDTYAKRTSRYWQQYKRKNAPNDGDVN